jgi:phosphoglycolate phosphatase
MLPTPASAPARVAIFDLDGTLVDSRADLASAGNHARQQVGLPLLPLPQIISYVGDGLDQLIARLVPDPARHAEAKHAFEVYYAAHCCDESVPYDGIIACLQRLRERGWHCAVATNKPGRFTDIMLPGCGLASYFSAVQSGDGIKKPAPDQLYAVMAAHGAEAKNCWMIGDNHTDIRAGQAAGCRVAFCLWGFGQRDGLIPDAQVAAPLDLIAALCG